jgi:Tfp pilus assembly protein FimT
MMRATRSSIRRRAGFSLLELLVVLGIIIIITSIGISAFLAIGKVSRLTATEQLITDLVRQARYTARVTGQAVILYVDPDARTISGVTRLALWSSGGESGNEPFESTSPTLAPADFQTPFGHSGAGFTRQASATTPAAITLYNGPGDNAHINRQLTRRARGATEGFQLSAVVRAQRIYTPPTFAPPLIPLLVLSADDPSTVPNTETAFAGLMLRRLDVPMFDSNETPPKSETTGPAPGTPLIPVTNPERRVWQLVGWILPESGGTPIMINETDDALQMDETSLNTAIAQRQAPDIGEQWHEVSLLFSGSTLELFRDGRTIARKSLPAGSTYRVAGNGAAHRLFIGSASAGASLANGILTAGTTAQIDSKTTIDDISLFRLGVDLPHQLPVGVVPDAAYRIALHPNGRIANLTSIANPLTWNFRGVFNEAEDMAAISLDRATGRVTSSKVTLSASAP